jgi:hypothetical protein
MSLIRNSPVCVPAVAGFAFTDGNILTVALVVVSLIGLLLAVRATRLRQASR